VRRQVAFKRTVLITGESITCPLYRPGDRIEVSGHRLRMEEGRPVCIRLATEIVRQGGGTAGVVCGCPSGWMTAAPQPDGRRGGEVPPELDAIPFFEAIEGVDPAELLPFMQIRRYRPGEVVIRHGEPGRTLYVIISGILDAIHPGGVRLASLGPGEIFGEMSLISGDPTAATVAVRERAVLFCLTGDYFRRLLERLPRLQTYIVRLLIRRLYRMNADRIHDLSRTILGSLTEVRPAELAQLIHAGGKTGRLRLDLPGGEAELRFRDGELVGARYGRLMGERAFRAILGERRGGFRFRSGLAPQDRAAPPVGNFMNLLMRSLRRIESGQAATPEAAPPGPEPRGAPRR
jgi:CRP/FNR family transcriptional regulator, cyclic AMP receptor protein